jgi:regulator of sirC expression with transglutaminase-like and TPR domain
MTALSATPSTGNLSPGQRAALVRLLEDEDPGVQQAVRDRILACGETALEWLRPHLLQPNPVVRRRVQEIVELLARRIADGVFLTFCLRQGEDFDVEQGIWLLAKTRYPEINVAAYQALLDSHAADLRDRLPGGGSAEEVLGVMREYLFEGLGYMGSAEDYYDPDNSYLNRVIDRRTGNPISLCAIYLLLAKRLHLPISGIGMPSHFLCRYQTPTEETFIDVFNGGRLLTKADCLRHLLQSNLGVHEGLLVPATPRRILLRMCSNLHQIYLHFKAKQESRRLQSYVVALAK